MRLRTNDPTAQEGQMWESAFDLIDKLEELTGAEVTFITKNKVLCGFQLVANGRVLMVAEYHESTQDPSDSIDVLGGMYIGYLTMRSAEAQMPVKVGQRFVLRGSLAQVVLSYAVSEPGYWTIQEIIEDIDQKQTSVVENVRSLKRRNMILQKEDRIYPTEIGKIALMKSMRLLTG